MVIYAALQYFFSRRKDFRHMQLIVQDLVGARGGNELFTGLCFTLNSGEGLAVTGPNGSGKSTLLRILAGLLSAESGSITMCDETGSTETDCVHFLGSLNAMKDQLTASENLAFWQQFLGNAALSPTQALEAVNLPHIADLPFGYLSTGQKRRVAIARLLCADRPIWLVDEPTSGLDKASEQMFADLANAHLKRGGILVAATHLPLGIEGLRTLMIGAQ
jgi:heme exporter protein A